MAKQYSINVENDTITSIEVDGVRYENADDIPDASDRERILTLIAAHNNETMEFAMDMDVPDFKMDTHISTVDTSFIPKIIISLFTTISVVSLGVATYTGIKAHQVQAREVTTTGQVVEIIPHRDEEDGTIFYHPNAVFSLPNDDRQTVDLGGYSPESPYAVGEEVAIAYDPQNPRNARINSFGGALELWILPIILGTLGTAFGGATLLAIWITRGDTNKTRCC